MKQLKFSIFDSKVGAFLPDWNCPTAAGAIRLFQEGCLIPESPYFKHPGDYTLFQIGTFDQDTGDVEKTPKIDHGLAIYHKTQALLEQSAHQIPREDALRNLPKKTEIQNNRDELAKDFKRTESK